MNEYDEYMFNPSAEFDEQIEELKDSLRSSVKGEFLKRIAELEKELAELRELKENWDEKVNEINKEKRELEKARSEAKREAEKTRLSELLADCFKEAWSVTEKYYYPNVKCDECDEEGYITFLSPQGREFKDKCKCRQRKLEYILTKSDIVEICQEKFFKPTIYFKHLRYADTEYYEKIASVFFCDDKPFNDVEAYTKIFFDKEKAQAYCDWLNQKQEEE